MSKRYENLGLTHNPFKIPFAEQEIIDPQKDLLSDVERFCVSIREREVEWIHNKITQPLISGAECPNIWIAGKRGVGKSALLKYIVHTLGGTSILPLYIKKPLRGLPDIYTKTIRFLGEDYFIDLSWSAYLEFFKQLKPENAQFIKTAFDRVAQFVLEDISRLLFFFKPTEEGNKKLEEQGLSANDLDVKKMATAMAAWLMAKCNVLITELATIIANFPISPDEQYMKLMKLQKAKQIDCLISILLLAEKVKGVRAGLLIIDELDQVWEGMNYNQKRTLGLDIRKIYEGSRGKVKLIAACLPLGSEMFKDFEKITYITDVIPTTPEHILDVFEFDSEQTKRLVAHYLSKARLSDRQGFIEPFTDTVILAVNRRCAGNAREMLKEFEGLIEYAADKGYSIIDEKVMIERKPDYEEIISMITKA